jgi:hypothetical protein
MDDFYKPKHLRDRSNSSSEVGDYFDWKRLEMQLLIPFAEFRLLRGIERDGIEMKDYWQNVWMKQENDYYQKQKPFLLSDIKINGYHA